jgi:hypothetical protein
MKPEILEQFKKEFKLRTFTPEEIEAHDKEMESKGMEKTEDGKSWRYKKPLKKRSELCIDSGNSLGKNGGVRFDVDMSTCIYR